MTVAGRTEMLLSCDTLLVASSTNELLDLALWILTLLILGWEKQTNTVKS